MVKNGRGAERVSMYKNDKEKHVSNTYTSTAKGNASACELE